jgi:hypothetical protein
LKFRNTLSPAKFRKHITKEIADYLDYYLRNINPRSPSHIIQDQLDELNKKSKGVIYSRLGYKNRTVYSNIDIPVNGWYWELERIGDE